jgi:homoserine kinase type II
LIDAYLAVGAVPGDEVEAALPTMLRFRYAVQADHIARRIWAADRTGPVDEASRTGLREARALLGA